MRSGRCRPLRHTIRDSGAGGSATGPSFPPKDQVNLQRIRNLSIVAHVDHGKSTLSDRILELTGAVDAHDMREQYLDSMDIERSGASRSRLRTFGSAGTPSPST